MQVQVQCFVSPAIYPLKCAGFYISRWYINSCSRLNIGTAVSNGIDNGNGNGNGHGNGHGNGNGNDQW